MGIFFAGIAESAGAIHQLNRGTVLGLWLLVDAAALAAVVWFHRPIGERIIGGVKQRWARIWARSETSPVSPCGAAMLFLAAALILLVGAVALQAPTTIWDSQTYHMPRVMHWLQQQSLSHYPTNNPRQLESAPGAEIQSATLYLLFGDDWPVNLPQWWALLTCALLASFLAERLLQWHFGPAELDARKVRLCGLLAAVAAITVPQGVMEAISTQNDLMSSLWVMALAVFGLLLAQTPRNYFYAAGVAGAFALGVNNKATMFLYAAPFGLALALWLWVKSRRMFFALGAATAVFALALNLPWMARNYETFHRVLASRETLAKLPMQNRSAAKITANVCRNLALYTGTPFDSATSTMNNLLLCVYTFIWEPPQESGSVWPTAPFRFSGNSEIKRGDGLGSFMAILPVLLAVGVFLCNFKWKSPVTIYLGLLALGFVLFCGYLRWQPWHARLHLPFFILAAPLVGMVLGWAWPRGLALGAALALVFNALLVLFYNIHYPINLQTDESFNSREERYFCEHYTFYAGTAELAQDIVSAGATNVLLKIGYDTWEYPLWVCLKDRGFQGAIQHAFVENESAPRGAPDLNLPRTVIVVADAEIAPPADYGLRVRYDGWSACYRGKQEERWKLIDNQASTSVPAEKAGRLQIRCHAIDQNGQAVTNNAIRLEAGDFAAQFPLSSEETVLACPLKAGRNPLHLVCVHPPSAAQRIITLAGLAMRVEEP